MSPTTRSMGLVPCKEPFALPRPRGVRIASYTYASVLTGKPFGVRVSRAEGLWLWPRASAEQGTADDLFHDLGRPAVDGLDAAVGEGPGDGVLGHVAVAAL